MRERSRPTREAVSLSLRVECASDVRFTSLQNTNFGTTRKKRAVVFRTRCRRAAHAVRRASATGALQLVDEARVENVAVTLSRPPYESAFFAEYLEPFASRVSFDVIDLPFGNRFAAAIARIRSDYVISVYADYGASILAPRCSVPDLGAALARVDSSGILHYGYTGSVHRWRERGRRTRGTRHPTGSSLPRFRRKHRWSQSHP